MRLRSAAQRRARLGRFGRLARRRRRRLIVARARRSPHDEDAQRKMQVAPPVLHHPAQLPTTTADVPKDNPSASAWTRALERSEARARALSCQRSRFQSPIWTMESSGNPLAVRIRLSHQHTEMAAPQMDHVDLVHFYIEASPPSAPRQRTRLRNPVQKDLRA